MDALIRNGLRGNSRKKLETCLSIINIPPDEEDEREKEDHKRLHPQDREENILEISQRLGRSLQDSFSVIFNPDHREHDIHDSYRYLHHSPAKVMYESQGKCVGEGFSN